MNDKDFDPANMTPEEKRELLKRVGLVSFYDDGFAQDIAAIGALAEFQHKVRQYGKRFKAMLGSEIPIREHVQNLMKGLGVSAIFKKMGLLPYAGRPQCAANVTCFYKDENGATFILVGKKGDYWLTPQGFMDSVTPAIDDPDNENFDFSLEDTGKRELRQEGGVDADKEHAEVFEALCLPRRFNPGGNDMIIRPTAVGVALSRLPEMREADNTFERLEWVPLSYFADEGEDLNSFYLGDGHETGEMPVLPEGLPYIFIISEVMNRHLDRICLSALNMSADGVAERFKDFPEKPQYMVGRNGQAYINAIKEGIKVLSLERANLPQHELKMAT